MDDDASDGELSTRDWMLEQVVGEGPALIVTGKRRTADDESAGQPTEAVDDDRQGVLDDPSAGHDFDAGRTLPHELDNPSGANSDEGPGADINSAAKRTAVWLGSGVLAVAVLIVLALVVFGGGPDPVAPPQHHVRTPAVADAPATASPPVPQQDHAVSFSARTDS